MQGYHPQQSTKDKQRSARQHHQPNWPTIGHCQTNATKKASDEPPLGVDTGGGGVAKEAAVVDDQPHHLGARIFLELMPGLENTNAYIES